MLQNRRNFIATMAKASAAMLTAGLVPTDIFAAGDSERLTILHTNDTHSRLDPFPADDNNYGGMGGVAARFDMIKKIRQQEKNVLLLDAGDIFQGTPYFNLFKGEPEIKAMELMGYDAFTLGNHDFDAGIANIAAQLMKTSMSLVICNYDFTGTPLQQKYLPYKVFKKGALKIGVTGVGINLAGIVHSSLYGNTKYLDPVMKLNQTASHLKHHEHCDMIICLSHLGDRYDDNRMSDAILAKESYDVDLIIGGHTHKFFETPRVYKNKNGGDVVVNQAGWAGLRLARLDYEFFPGKNKNLAANKSIVIAKKTAD